MPEEKPEREEKDEWMWRRHAWDDRNGDDPKKPNQNGQTIQNEQMEDECEQRMGVMKTSMDG